MSHVRLPRTIIRADAAHRGIVSLPFASESDRFASADPIDAEYTPVSKRTAYELQANACELRKMAGTATTQDVVRSLLTLAERYSALADKRRQEEGGPSSPPRPDRMKI